MPGVAGDAENAGWTWHLYGWLNELASIRKPAFSFDFPIPAHVLADTDGKPGPIRWFGRRRAEDSYDEQAWHPVLIRHLAIRPARQPATEDTGTHASVSANEEKKPPSPCKLRHRSIFFCTFFRGDRYRYRPAPLPTCTVTDLHRPPLRCCEAPVCLPIALGQPYRKRSLTSRGSPHRPARQGGKRPCKKLNRRVQASYVPEKTLLVDGSEKKNKKKKVSLRGQVVLDKSYDISAPQPRPGLPGAGCHGLQACPPATAQQAGLQA